MQHTVLIVVEGAIIEIILDAFKSWHMAHLYPERILISPLMDDVLLL